MVSLKVGMYVRYTKNGYLENVAKVISIMPPELPSWTEYYRLDNGNGISPIDIIKADSKLIKLIEVGDYVNGKPVAEIDEDFKEIFLDDNDRGWRTVIEKDDIKSVVTKQCFESLMYEVK